MVWNPKLGVNVAALLHCIIPLWKLPISLHKQAKQRFHMNIAVLISFKLPQLDSLRHTGADKLCAQAHLDITILAVINK